MLTRVVFAALMVSIGPLSSCSDHEREFVGTWTVVRHATRSPVDDRPVVAEFEVTIRADGTFSAVTRYESDTPELREYGWWRFVSPVLAFTYWHSEEPPDEPLPRPDPAYKVLAIHPRELILRDEDVSVVFTRTDEASAYPAASAVASRPRTDPHLVGKWRSDIPGGGHGDLTLKTDGNFTFDSRESSTPDYSLDGWWRVDGKSLLLNFCHPNGSEEDPPVQDQTYEVVANTSGKLTLRYREETIQCDRVR